MFASYLQKMRLFSRSTWLYLVSSAAIGFGYMGIAGVLLNLYLVRLGYGPEFAGLIFATGFAFESVGDFQLARFKADPRNQGQVLDRGLWAWTRHPNYFGDSLVWWGLFTIALATPAGVYTVLSPAVMTFFLVRISGVALLERSIAKRRPDYEAYRERTSAFIPRPGRAPGRRGRRTD